MINTRVWGATALWTGLLGFGVGESVAQVRLSIISPYQPFCTDEFVRLAITCPPSVRWYFVRRHLPMGHRMTTKANRAGGGFSVSTHPREEAPPRRGICMSREPTPSTHRGHRQEEEEKEGERRRRGRGRGWGRATLPSIRIAAIQAVVNRDLIARFQARRRSPGGGVGRL